MLVFLSCRIDDFFIAGDQSFSGSVSKNDVLYKIFGQLRKDIGSFCYLKADQYFHKGSHHADKNEPCLFETHDEEAENHSEDEHDHHRKTEHNGSPDLFAKIYKAIHFHPVVHLGSYENAEILPWFEITARFNPNFINAYLDGGFWLSTRMGQPDKALDFLREGLKNNPGSWQISAQIGEIYFTQKKDYLKAYSYFNNAYTLINTQPHTMLEKKSILIFLSASAEKINKHQESSRRKKERSELKNNHLPR